MIGQLHTHAHRSLETEELLYLLKTSRICKLKHETKIVDDKYGAGQLSKMNFMNSENWKASAYLNTVMSCFFLSTLVSIVEYAQTDITTLLQDWLNVVQFITSIGSSPEDHSFSYEQTKL